MVLIFGGAYQGKHEYAVEHSDKGRILGEFHLRILDLIKEGKDPVAYIRGHMDEYRDKVIICDDISCGVVPVDPLMRKWREAVGYCLNVLAGESDEVIRLFCGISTKIK